MTRKSLVACCGGCASGKPCCGDPKLPVMPKFEQRGGLLLPKRDVFRPQSLLGYPSPLEWPGGRFWPGKPMDSATFDLSCMPCCDGNCCTQIAGETITATVTAITGLCGTLLGCSAALTETSLAIWTGTLNTCGCTGISLIFSCTALSCPPGEQGFSLTTSGCPGAGSTGTACGTCLDVTFPAITVTAGDLVCNCCGGFGGGGTFTVTVTL